MNSRSFFVAHAQDIVAIIGILFLVVHVFDRKSIDRDHVQPIGLVFITMREWFPCHLKEVRVLVNALSVVKSLYFYTKIYRLIQITKPVKLKKKRVRIINDYSQYTVISENILHSFLWKERGSFSENYY